MPIDFEKLIIYFENHSLSVHKDVLQFFDRMHTILIFGWLLYQSSTDELWVASNLLLLETMLYLILLCICQLDGWHTHGINSYEGNLGTKDVYL